MRRIRKLKAAQADYTSAMLPHNRKEVFFDIVKLHWKSFLLLGFVVLICQVVHILLSVLQDLYLVGIGNGMPEADKEAYLQEARYVILRYCNTRAVAEGVMLALFSIIFSGFVRIIRQYSWLENVQIFPDMVRGIKQNVKQMIMLGLIMGIIYAACFSMLSIVLYSDTGNLFMMIPIGMSMLLALPVAGYVAVSISLYNNSFFSNIKLGFYLYLKAPWKTLLALACCGGFYLTYLINNPICHIVFPIIGSILFPFSVLGWTLFAYDQLDCFVNKQSFPELVGRGTYTGIEE